LGECSNKRGMSFPLFRARVSLFTASSNERAASERAPMRESC
jgi:hypothetical protein